MEKIIYNTKIIYLIHSIISTLYIFYGKTRALYLSRFIWRVGYGLLQFGRADIVRFCSLWCRTTLPLVLWIIHREANHSHTRRHEIIEKVDGVKMQNCHSFTSFLCPFEPYFIFLYSHTSLSFPPNWNRRISKPDYIYIYI
jgi:hypothetical protein